MAKAAAAARAPTQPAVSASGRPDEVPHRGHGVRRPVGVGPAAQDPDGSRLVLRPVGVGQDEGAAALRRRRAVEQVERLGDERRGQDVLRREGAAAVVDRLGVDVAVVADHGGRRRQLLLGRAVGDHVAPGHQGELGRREEPEPGDELVGRRRPRGRHRVLQQPAPPARATATRLWPVVTSAAASRMAAMPRALGRRMLGPRPSSRMASADAAPTTASTSAVAMPASASAPRAASRAIEAESCSAGQPPRLRGVVDPDDGDVTEGMAHRDRAD